MKKLAVILIALAFAGYFIPASVASAEVLNDNQLADVYAGENTDLTDIIDVNNSVVGNQKNIAVIGSTDSNVSGSIIGQENTAELTNAGDSTVAIQANIAAIGLGGGASDGNSINNSNDATIANTVSVGDAGVNGTAEGSTNGGTGANSVFTDIVALNSAVASQSNIAAVAGAGTITNTLITNSNNATVANDGI